MKSFKTFITEIHSWSHPWVAGAIAKGQETMNKSVGKHHVINKIHITFHKDRTEYHYGGKLIDTTKGDYSQPTKRHLAIASRKTGELYKKHRVKE